MFPIRDTIPSQRPPVVTKWLIGVNVVVFLFQLMVMGAGEELGRGVMGTYGFVPARWFHPDADFGDFVWGCITVFTSMFMHGGVAHLLFNMWTLWIFGDNVEDRMGRKRFVLFYLMAGVMAVVLHCLEDPTAVIPVVGASGAIAGVMGAYLVMFPKAQVVVILPPLFFLPFVLPAVLYLGFWFLTQLLSGVASLGLPDMGGGVAFWAHIGGFVGGLAAARGFLARPVVVAMAEEDAAQG